MHDLHQVTQLLNPVSLPLPSRPAWRLLLASGSYVLGIVNEEFHI